MLPEIHFFFFIVVQQSRVKRSITNLKVQVVKYGLIYDFYFDEILSYSP